MSKPLSDKEFDELFQWASVTEAKRIVYWARKDANRIHNMVFRALLELAYCDDNTERKRIINQEVQT